MIAVVVPYCHKDRLAAIRLLEWMRELDGERALPTCFLVSSKPITDAEDKEVIGAAFRAFQDVWIIKQKVADERGWPQSPNTLFRCACDRLKSGTGPWLWLEPDATPTKPGWLKMLDDEYRSCGKPFMGFRTELPWPHLNGVAIYPPNVEQLARFLVKPNANAFDCTTPQECAHLLTLAYASPLFQHEWSPCEAKDLSLTSPARTFDETLDGLNPEAVLFHRCKDGSLITELRRRRDEPEIVVTQPANLTVVITTYRRPQALKLAFESCRSAGVKNIVIAGACPDADEKALHKDMEKAKWANVILAVDDDDPSANRSWLRGVNEAQTEWVHILHDDDMILPSYARLPDLVAKHEKSVGFFHWAGAKHYLRDNGTTENIPETHAPMGYLPEGVKPTDEMWHYILAQDGLSISPVSGLFRKDHLVETLVRCAEEFTTDDFFYRPNMMVGNDLMIWLNAVENNKRFYHIKRPLISYGHHDGSVSYWDVGHRNGELGRIYNATRSHFLEGPPFTVEFSRQLVHVQNLFTPTGDALKRQEDAQRVWKEHHKKGNWVEVNLSDSDFPRLFQDPNRKVPYLKDILDRAVAVPGIEDDAIYVLTNTDVIPVRSLTRQLLLCFNNYEACYSFRRDIKTFKIHDERQLRLETNCYSGVDLIAFTHDWWNRNRDSFPDMLYATEAWDYLMQLYMNDHGGKRFFYLIYHVTHQAEGLRNLGSPSQQHNRALAEPFLRSRGIQPYWEKSNNDDMSPR